MSHDVLFIDTSVLCNLIEVPGRNQHATQVKDEFRRLVHAGTRFVIPITTVIETGNHIANASGDRRAAAERLVALLELAETGTVPWQLHEISWDGEFLAQLRSGAATGQPLVDLLGNAQLGTGDVAILCERDAFRDRTDFTSVGIWTLERTLAAYA